VVNIKVMMCMLDDGNTDIAFPQLNNQFINERGFAGIAASCADADNR
jgi:hypothetical protein